MAARGRVGFHYSAVNTPLSDRFGELIKRLRLDAAMSQEGLAHAAELHPTYISRLETGDRTPTIAVAEKLALALKDNLILAFRTSRT